MSIALGGKEEFVSVLELVEKECSYHLNRLGDDHAEHFIKCLYRKGKSPALYVKIDGETEMYPPKGENSVDHTKYQDKQFRLDASIKIESIYVSDTTTSS